MEEDGAIISADRSGRHDATEGGRGESGETTSEARHRKPEDFGLLRAAALIGLPVGAVGSVALTLYAGRHNESRLLVVLFAIWVLSPFVVLVLASLFSKHWSARTQMALYGVMLVLTVSSLVIYGAHALWPPRAQAAFVFVVVPPASWLLIAVVIAIAALISRRLPRG